MECIRNCRPDIAVLDLEMPLLNGMAVARELISQGLNSLLLAMEDMSVEVGRMSKRFKHAEGWRRHLHFGFCKADTDPLRQSLGKNFLVNNAYERDLEE